MRHLTLHQCLLLYLAPWRLSGSLLATVLTILVAICLLAKQSNAEPAEIVFWHFWGGRDRPVVEGIVERFNASQNSYRVRPIAMPGSNLDLKFFLSVAGGDPPDLLNQDDPIVADWASRGVLTPLDELATQQEITSLNDWLYPAARKLGSYDQRLFALVNGLDIRALYYNRTWLEEAGLPPPQSLAELDHIARELTPSSKLNSTLSHVGYLPDPRRLWAWAVVFGGRFYDPEGQTIDEQVTLDSPENLAALKWMASYSQRLGADRVTSFRTGDQSLTGASFPLLADRRYAMMMDGQWRVRDLAEASTTPNSDQYGVVQLPPPDGGRTNAGWVNGNFFIVPRGAKQPQGAWAFMKFWTGLGGNEAEAARVAAEGGWIPASPKVVEQPAYQALLREQTLMRTFVDLAASKQQVPTPPLPIAAFYYREVIAAAQDVMYRGADPEERLATAAKRVRRQLRAATQN